MTMTRRKFLQRFAGVAAASFIAKQVVKPVVATDPLIDEEFNRRFAGMRFDILYGTKVVRPDLVCRVWSA